MKSLSFQKQSNTYCIIKGLRFMRNRLSIFSLKNHQPTDFFSKKSSDSFGSVFSNISLYGIANEKDESKQKYIIQMNLIAIVTFTINCVTGVLFFFINDLLPGLMFIFSGIVWLLPIYFNRNGLTIKSRFLLVIFSVAILEVASCWFSHDSMLDNFFLILAIDCNFVYSSQEKKWLMISVFLCLIFFIIETTSLQNYLPAFNAIKDLKPTNIILLISQILTILIDVMVYVYINRLRENNLLAKRIKLEETQRRVQIQNDDLKTFSIAASHSMQTPLYVSSFFLEKVKNEIEPIATEESKQSIELIRNGLNQMEVLVSGLFSYNRIINIENERTEFDVFKEIELVKKSILPRYPNAKIIIASSNQVITSNKLLFSIIIYNLIDNAMKYNRSEKPEVVIELNKNMNRLTLLVKDNGIGIPQNYFSVIFEPFKRIQADMQIKPGNGLGLAGAKRAAERIGGNLFCEKSDHTGTVFKLEIPTE